MSKPVYKKEQEGEGIRILSLGMSLKPIWWQALSHLHRHLDNGGPGTYSQLLILKECMNHLAADLELAEDDIYPADYFDLMGGVGFGG